MLSGYRIANMKVKFLQDFQGRETKEIFYVKGQEVELDSDAAASLLRDGFVEPIEVREPVTEAAQPTKRGKK